MSTLEDWTGEVRANLGLESDVVDITAVLDMARDVAHGVARPAAPLTAYMVGVAVGRGEAPAEAAERIAALARSWTKADDD
jgi:hypothetical protein